MQTRSTSWNTHQITRTLWSPSSRAILFGGLSALGAALFSIGIPKDSVIEYEQAVKTDGFLVVAHGSADEMARSKAILESSNPTRIDLHENVKTQVSDQVQAAVKTDEVVLTR